MSTPRIDLLAGLLCLAASLLSSHLVGAVERQSALTYQGRLLLNQAPVDGTYDLQFALFMAESGGTPVDTINHTDMAIDAGYVLADLDFTDAAFRDNEAYWLEIRVRDAQSSGPFTPLSPRQMLAPTPYALSASSLAPSSVETAQLAANAVTTSQLANATLASADFSASSVTANAIGNCVGIDCPVNSLHVAPQAVTSASIQADAVQRFNIAAAAVASAELTTDAVSASHFAAGTISSEQLAAKLVSSVKVADQSVTSSTIGAAQVNASKFADGSLQAADFEFLFGDITGVTANAGLSGGGLQGTLALQTSPASTQARLTPCDIEQGLVEVDIDGISRCEPIAGDTRMRSHRLATGGTTTNAHPQLVIGGDGLPVVLFFNEAEDTLQLLKCASLDCSAVSHATDIATQQTSDSSASLAIGGHGFPLVVYRDTDPLAGWVYLRMAVCMTHDCASGTVVRELANGTLSFAASTSIAISSAGLPHVLYVDQFAPQMGLIRCDDATCATHSDTLGMIFGNNNDLFHAGGVVIPDDQRPLICFGAYSASSAIDTIQFARCSDPQCSAVSSTLSLSGFGGTDMRSCEIALNSMGAATLVWTDGPSSNQRQLSITQCDDLDCTTRSTHVFAEGTLAPPSLAIGPNGEPWIAYFDLLENAPLLAQCEDTHCNAIRSVLLSGFRNADAIDVTADPSGKPLISLYSNSSNGPGAGVVVSRCGTRNCL